MNDNSKESFHNFLEDFCRYHHGEVTEEGPLPMRFLSNSLTVKETEAEVIDWALQYLTSKCPRLLGTHIARKVADHVLSLDLGQFAENTDKEEALETKGTETNNEKKDSKASGTNIDNDTVLLISALAPVVFTEVHSLCERWLLKLPEDILPEKSPLSPVKDVSVHAIKNSRRKMEDKHVVHTHLKELYHLPVLREHTLTYLSVFDGHGGQHGSNYAAAHFHDKLVKSDKLSTDLPTALKESFLQTDKGFCQKAERESLGSGTTGVCAVIANNTLQVGWLGDSEALLVRDGRPVKLMTPHKPERPDEQNRIKALGGFVQYKDGVYRVNGLISVARAIGDRNLKPYLCADADVTSVPLDGTEDYVVLGCDGLWDVVTHEEIIDHVYRHIEEVDGDRSGVAQMLVRLAKEQGSEDNISVIVAFLREKTSPPKSAKEEEVSVCERADDVEKNDGGTEKNDNTTSNQVTEQQVISDTSKGSSGSDSKSSFEPGAKQAGSGTLNSMEISEAEISSGSPNKESSDPPCDLCATEPGQEEMESPERHVSVQTSSNDKPEKSHSGSNRKGRSTSVSIKSNSKTKSHYSDNHSGSSGELKLLAQAAKCANNRRGRRARNGRRRNNHRDARRPSKESQASAGIAHRTNGGAGRTRSSSESKAASEKLSIMSSHTSGENVFRMLMGCNANVIHRSRSQSRWTVAVELEIESASAMFDELIPIREVSGKQNLQKK